MYMAGAGGLAFSVLASPHLQGAFMKKRAPMSTGYAEATSLPVRTGEHCPETGWWQPVKPQEAGLAFPSRFVGEGSVMPAVAGAPAFWMPTRN